MQLGGDAMCFGCGPANPIGLHLEFCWDEDWYQAEFIAGANYQGYDGYLHGGIIATLFDEAMARHLYARDLIVMTAELVVRYRQAIVIGQPLTVASRLLSSRHGLHLMEARIMLPSHRLMASARGKLLETTSRTGMENSATGNNG